MINFKGFSFTKDCLRPESVPLTLDFSLSETIMKKWKFYICDVLLDLVPFVQFKKREKHPWRSITFTKSNASPWVLFTFFKLYKWYQIAQHITYLTLQAFILGLARQVLVQDKVFLEFSELFYKGICFQSW